VAAVSSSIQILRGIGGGEEEPLPNPKFVDNGYDPTPSTASKNFLRRQYHLLNQHSDIRGYNE
jgi:hypothetical protein